MSAPALGWITTAFTQLPDGAQVEVIGTEGEWVKVLLPEREAMFIPTT